MKQLTLKQAQKKGGRNRAKNLRKKLGLKGFSDLMSKVALARPRNLSPVSEKKDLT